MWPLGTFWCIRIVSTTFLGGNAKKHGNYELRQAETRFSAIFPKIGILRYMLICCSVIAHSHLLLICCSLIAGLISTVITTPLSLSLVLLCNYNCNHGKDGLGKY